MTAGASRRAAGRTTIRTRHRGVTMSRKPVVCLAGTLDTKGTEYAFVRDALLAADVDVLVVDCGVLGEPSFAPDIPASEVAARAGIDLGDFSGGRRRGA